MVKEVWYLGSKKYNQIRVAKMNDGLYVVNGTYHLVVDDCVSMRDVNVVERMLDVISLPEAGYRGHARYGQLFCHRLNMDTQRIELFCYDSIFAIRNNELIHACADEVNEYHAWAAEQVS